MFEVSLYLVVNTSNNIMLNLFGPHCLGLINFQSYRGKSLNRTSNVIAHLYLHFLKSEFMSYM